MTLEQAVEKLLDAWHSSYSPKWVGELETALREVEKAFYATKDKQ